MAERDPYAAYATAVSDGPTLKERQTGASIGASEASAASSAASAKRTAALTGPQVRKEKALARQAELNAEKLQLAIEKARAQTSGRPSPENLADAQRAVMDELKAALAAKKLSKEMFSGSGFGYSTLSEISGTPAASVASLLKPIQANMAFTKLQDMRTKSPTGAALGAVSDKELALLSNSEAPIDPTASDEVFQSGLDTVIGNRIQMLTRLGADPYEVAALIPEEDRPLYKNRFMAYRLVPDDVKKISAYVDQARKNGTFDPTDYAALVGEAFYNATGRQPDEGFVTSAAQTGAKLAADPKAVLSNFDYTPADAEVQSRVLGEELGGPKDARSLGTAIGQGAINFVPSVFELGYDTLKALTVNLPETIEGVAKVVGGATGLSDDPAAYNALKKYYKDRYGNYEGFKKALATDPASILADVAGIATGGATIAAKGLSTAGKVSKISALADAAKAAEGFGQFVAKADPLVIGGKTVKLGADLGGKVAGTSFIDVPAKLAGTTGESLRQGFEAGKRGSPEFLEQMRGTADVNAPIQKAEAALGDMYKARSAEYQRRMARMDKTETLDWTDIDDALTKSEAIGKHKGIDISGASGVWEDVYGVVDQFRAKGLNTIEDFDAMKRAIRNIGSKYQVGTPEYKVAQDVAKAINEKIVAKAPQYARIMNDYRLASDTLEDIKASISAGAKSGDTTLAKLRRKASGQGPRGTTILDMLEQTPSGRGLGDMLAGQNLSGTEPAAMTTAMSTPAAAASGNPAVLGTAMLTPRNLGERAYQFGSAYGPVERGVEKVRATAPAKRVEDLAAKYFPSGAAAVRAVNPVIQAQVDPFAAPQSQDLSAQAMAELRKRYGVGSPTPVLRSASTPSLADLISAYSKPTGVSLEAVKLPNGEEEEEEEVVEYARGGMVVAPMLGMRR